MPDCDGISPQYSHWFCEMADDLAIEQSPLVVAGLANCGSTCWLNSVLQVIMGVGRAM